MLNFQKFETFANDNLLIAGNGGYSKQIF